MIDLDVLGKAILCAWAIGGIVTSVLTVLFYFLLR